MQWERLLIVFFGVNKNMDNWPLKIDNKIIVGGCQECWEKECSDSWWDMVDKTS